MGGIGRNILNRIAKTGRRPKDRFGLPRRVLHTPGHSSGDLTVLLDDRSAFVGDPVRGRRIP